MNENDIINSLIQKEERPIEQEEIPQQLSSKAMNGAVRNIAAAHKGDSAEAPIFVKGSGKPKTAPISSAKIRKDVFMINKDKGIPNNVIFKK